MAGIGSFFADSRPIPQSTADVDLPGIPPTTAKDECTTHDEPACILHPLPRLAISPLSSYPRPVFPGKPDRPYFESWLRRTRKQLAGSGRLSEIALILSREEGRTPQYWSTYLREVLEEETTPSLDLLTRLDAILARPVPAEIPLDSPPLFSEPPKIN